MRTYGRDSTGTWVQVATDAATGDNSNVWFTTLLQNLLLNQGESPFYSKNGIPALQSVRTQMFPTIAVNSVQSYFAPYFSSLIITRNPATYPSYSVSAVTLQGSPISATIAY
jgi:hypothetical protein